MTPFTFLLLATALLAIFLSLALFFPSRLSALETPQPKPRDHPAHLLIVLGSGGHTSEMLSLLSSLPTTRYTHRTYIISSGDSFSASQAAEFESSLPQTPAQPLNPQANQNGQVRSQHEIQEEEGRLKQEQEKDGSSSYSIHTLPRARKIHQSLLTTPWTCALTLMSSIQLITTLSHTLPGYPDLILTNGPATALIVLIASRMLKVWIQLLDLFSRRTASGQKGPMRAAEGTVKVDEDASADGQRRKDMARLKTMYIESWARVRTPSLTLKLVCWLRLGDRVIVQHERLAQLGWGEWRGDLMR